MSTDPRDRDYYRGMSEREILRIARDRGLDAEMAIALAECIDPEHRYAFNHSTKKDPTT